MVHYDTFGNGVHIANGAFAERGANGFGTRRSRKGNRGEQANKHQGDAKRGKGDHANSLVECISDSHRELCGAKTHQSVETSERGLGDVRYLLGGVSFIAVRRERRQYNAFIGECPAASLLCHFSIWAS